LIVFGLQIQERLNVTCCIISHVLDVTKILHIRLHFSYSPLCHSLPPSYFLSVVLPALVDRLGDGKDQVRENSQAVILRCMEQSASPMVRHTDQHINMSAFGPDEPSCNKDQINSQMNFEINLDIG